MIYFVEAKDIGLIKIGFTLADPASRLAVFRIGSPVPLMGLAVMEGDVEVERAIHRRFHRLRSHGEWFRADPRLRRYVAAHARPWEDGAFDDFLTPEDKEKRDKAKAGEWAESCRWMATFSLGQLREDDDRQTEASGSKWATPGPLRQDSFDLRKLRERLS